MKSPLFLASILLITLLSLSITLPTTYAQDYTRWGLPEGATARLGKGEAYAIQFSSDGTQLAVASGAGIWSYDTRTGKEINLIPCTMDLLRSAWRSVQMAPPLPVGIGGESGCGMWALDASSKPLKGIGVGSIASRLVLMAECWQVRVMTIRFVYGMSAVAVISKPLKDIRVMSVA